VSKEVIPARIAAAKTFTFPDGSVVKIHGDGMLVLKSSDKKIDDLFVTSLVGTDLSMVAGQNLGGDPFYHKPNQQKMQFERPVEFWSAHLEKFIQTITDHVS
jgi:hypothetical protein